MSLIQYLSRLIGLEPLITSTCANDIRIIVYDTQFKADSFLNPIVLFFTYYALALTTKNLIKARVSGKITNYLINPNTFYDYKQTKKKKN